MAATGFTPILIYGSGTASNTPSASNLTNSSNGSELAINYADGKLFYKDSGGTVQVIASKSAAAGTFSSVTITGGTINGASVGATTASTGAFTTLSASSTVSGTGFSTYLASPPAIGGTAAAAGTFTTLGGTTITASTQFSGPGTGLTGTASGLSIGGTAATATNVAGGAANQIVYQTGAGATSFVAAPTTASTYLGWNGSALAWSSVSSSALPGTFSKANYSAVAFTAPTGSTVSTQTNLYVAVNGSLLYFASGTSVVMPTLTAGTDYAIYACYDSTIRADSSFTNPSGYTTANSYKIGGFHYAPGGNATGQSGGNTTPAINVYSFWDLKFKPKCPDPRGMVLVANSFWSDIYLLNINHITNGTSKYNVAYARGTTPPLVPTQFGGNGSTAYGEFNWWEAGEVAMAYGKRLARYEEFAALAYGTTEASSIGSDQSNTVLNAAYTSKWGVIQSSGVLWAWGDEFGGGAAGAGWVDNTIGRGQTYQLSNAVFLGGAWGFGSLSGSRCSFWFLSPTFSDNDVGSRCVCDHLILV